MGGDELTGLFESLETTFSAASAAADRSAADDLALSLQQDRWMRDVLVRGGWGLRTTDARVEQIAEVGSDHIQTVSGALVPLKRVIAVSLENPAPLARSESLLERLRGWARASAKVQVDALNGEIRGLLLSAGRDHLIMSTRQGRCLVPLEAVVRISRRRGSSADAS